MEVETRGRNRHIIALRFEFCSILLELAFWNWNWTHFYGRHTYVDKDILKSDDNFFSVAVLVLTNSDSVTRTMKSLTFTSYRGSIWWSSYTTCGCSVCLWLMLDISVWEASLERSTVGMQKTQHYSYEYFAYITRQYFTCAKQKFINCKINH